MSRKSDVSLTTLEPHRTKLGGLSVNCVGLVHFKEDNDFKYRGLEVLLSIFVESIHFRQSVMTDHK